MQIRTLDESFSNGEWDRQTKMVRAETELMTKFPQFKTTQSLLMLDPVLAKYRIYMRYYIAFLASAAECFIEVVESPDGFDSARWFTQVIDEIIKVRQDQERTSNLNFIMRFPRFDYSRL